MHLFGFGVHICHRSKHFINHSNLISGIVYKNKKHLKQTKQLGAVCSLEHKTRGCQMWWAEILQMPGTLGTHGMAFVSLLEQSSPKNPTWHWQDPSLLQVPWPLHFNWWWQKSKKKQMENVGESLIDRSNWNLLSSNFFWSFLIPIFLFSFNKYFNCVNILN